MKQENRLKPLDGLRCLCIVSVVLFHYFTKFTPEYANVDYYPYHDVYWSFYPFRYGYLGVHCFFVISGFVIFMTLERSRNLAIFFLNRIIRLWPTLLICSIITYSVMTLSPVKDIHVKAIYFIPSLTITDPNLWQFFFKFQDINYIDGVEWSLACEVSFYIAAGLLFFSTKKVFYKTWLLYSLLVVGLSCIIKALNITRTELIDVLLFPRYLIFFTIGMYFYNLWKKKKMQWSIHIITFISVAFQFVVFQNYKEDIILLAFLLLFSLFIYNRLNILSLNFISRTGLISYSIYLLHNNIGLVLINKLSTLFKSTQPLTLVIPTATIIWMLSFFLELFISKIITPFLKARFKAIDKIKSVKPAY